jgi:caa(3)-type oxidase subunit IV
MDDAKVERGYAIYLRVWGFLLGLTMVMILLDRAELPWAALVLVLTVAMLAKATLIAGYFMHLRLESKLIVWWVVLGLGALAVVLYVLIVPDGLRIHDMVNAP